LLKLIVLAEAQMLNLHRVVEGNDIYKL
jgi:hypothetical protein